MSIVSQTRVLGAPPHIRAIIEANPELRDLCGSRLVLASSVSIVDPHEIPSPKYSATLNAAQSSARLGVPHIFMVDHLSHPDVFGGLRNAGAIVVPTTEGTTGLFTPYATASHIIDACGGKNAILCLVDGTNSILNEPKAIDRITNAGTNHAVSTGVRDRHTWASMSPHSQIVESMAALTITQILNVPYDVLSGILVLNALGRRLLRQYKENDRGYLIATPLAGRAHKNAGWFEIRFTYDPDLVAAGSNNDARWQQREQVGAMVDIAVELAGGRRLHQVNRQAYLTALNHTLGTN